MNNFATKLRLAIRAHVPTLVLGLPGVGKTAEIHAIGKAMSARLWTVIASFREPQDFGGLPIVGREKVTVEGESFSILEMAPPRYAVEAAATGGLIFLDEITQTPPAVQAPLMRLIHERVCGDLAMDPSKVAIVAAGNPPEVATGGWDIAPALANRFRHAKHVLDPASWAASFPHYWGSAPALEMWGSSISPAIWAKHRAAVAGFISARTSLLLAFPKNASEVSGPWPSPRTWDFVSRLSAAAESEGIEDRSIVLELAAETVGEGAALEYTAFLEDFDLPDPEEILAGKKPVSLPARGDRVFAVLTAVSAAVVGNLTADRWKRGWEVMAAALKEGRGDIAAVSAATLAKSPPKNAIPPPCAAGFAPILKAAGLLATQ